MGVLISLSLTSARARALIVVPALMAAVERWQARRAAGSPPHVKP